MKEAITLERFAATLSREGSIWLESAFCKEQPGGALLFSDPTEVVTLNSLSGLKHFFRTLEKRHAEGLFLAGWMSYEAGFGFEERLLHLTSSSRLALPPAPLGWFGVYRQPERFSAEEVQQLFAQKAHHSSVSSSALKALSFNLSEADYYRHITSIKEQIAAGNLYQVNYTGRYRFTFDRPAHALYAALRAAQPSSYSAMLNSAGRTILSFSPELFFMLRGSLIETMPMKGTAPRGQTEEEDRHLKEELGRCRKNLAENLMIVDLLRNDLGRICQPGTVKTAELFATESWPTLHQMLSTIRGELKESVGLYDLFRALYPCGSITGAPKISAMKLIQSLEREPRGIYTGTIGYITPDRDMLFSVAIRTIELFRNHGTYGSGSGIVWDSDPREEYRECQLKAKILSSIDCVIAPNSGEQEKPQENRLTEIADSTRAVVTATGRDEQDRECRLRSMVLDPRGAGIFQDADSREGCRVGAVADSSRKQIELFESILWYGSYLWLEEHLQRLAASANALGFTYDRAAAILRLSRLEEELRHIILPAAEPQKTATRFKVRLSLTIQGAISVSHEPIEVPASTAPLRLTLSGDRTDSTNPLLYHKTTDRELYNYSLLIARQKGHDEVIFLNERNEVTEGAISTLFIRQGRQLFTPPLHSGLLNGIYRHYILTTHPFATEKTLTLHDLNTADTIYIANSVRGLRPAHFPVRAV